MSLSAPDRAEDAVRDRRGGARRVLKRAMVVLMTLALIAGAGGVYFYKRLEGNITGVDINGTGNDLGNRPRKPPAAKDALNILIMGSDTRKGQGPAIKGVKKAGLSDTTILLHVSSDRTRAYGISIPRDTMLVRPACKTGNGATSPGGLTQFNAAYAIGGPLCTIKTVESITKVKIDHFVVVDFNGFRGMVNALGGVKVCVPAEVNDTAGKIHLAKGTYNVTGEQALDYVRVRHGISANGDIGRMKRQQTFVAAMIKKAVSAGTLANPVRLVRFLSAATKSLTTDSGFAHLKELAKLGSSLKNIGLDNVQFITAPWEPYAPDPNRVALAPTADELWTEVRLDRALGPAFTSQVVTAADKTPGAKGDRSTLPSKGVRRDLIAYRAGTLTLKDSKAQSASDKAQSAAQNGLCA